MKWVEVEVDLKPTFEIINRRLYYEFIAQAYTCCIRRYNKYKIVQ